MSVIPSRRCMLVDIATRQYLASFFFFNDTATTEIYTLSLHDALPISCPGATVMNSVLPPPMSRATNRSTPAGRPAWMPRRSEEHTSELQSLAYLVCRLLLEKKKESVRTQGPPPSSSKPAVRRQRPCRP